jgi:GT2 family glycosyltransferase
MISHATRACIVVLNWNGWNDTIGCLESIRQLDCHEICTVVVDNHSTDESVARIIAWAEPRCDFSSVRYEGKSEQLANAAMLLRPGTTLLIRSDENLGFAAGSNLGIRMAIRSKIEYVWLLNNDTVVAPDSLTKLVGLLDHHPEFVGATGQIRYHGKPETIWNCGGTLLPLGLRKYYFRDSAVSMAPARGHRPITFMTGCAALLRTAMLSQSGVLSEDFFFGEEDFELCQRLKRSGQKLACLYDAVIYHKVGTTISKAAQSGVAGKLYLHHLNRFVHMRRYWPEPLWNLWRCAYCFYLLYLLVGVNAISLRRSISLIHRLLSESYRLHRVDRTTFNAVLDSADQLPVYDRAMTA